MTAPSSSLRQARGVVLITLMALGLGGCPDDPPSRSAGSPCQADDSCDSNLCYTNVCLEPEVDDDLDGLINAVESQLGTNPYDADTDADGLGDGYEVGSAGNPHDEDGDGLIDAVESTLVDADNDCLSAQKDPDETVAEADVQSLADKGCCCYGSCSASGVTVAPATCEADETGTPVISCPPDLEPDTDGDGTPDNCDPCPNDVTDTCDFAPHSLATTPTSPSGDPAPTLSGIAPHAARIVVTQESCEGAVLAETNGTGGAFEVVVPVPANTPTTLYVTAYDVNDAALGCSDPIDYTHDDIAPAPPTLEEAFPVGNGENMNVAGSSEPDTTVSLFGGGACQDELISDLELSDGAWGIDLAPVLPASVSATATDDAGNTSECSPPLLLAPLANCTEEEITVLQSSDDDGDTILEALLTCSQLDASEGGCGGESPASGCVRCVVQQLYPDAIEVRAACSRCIARITPYMAACADVCTPEEAAEDGGDACLACACSQTGAKGAMETCGAGALCEESTGTSQGDLIEGPYLGPTCLDEEAGCITATKTLTPGCVAIAGGVSTTLDAEGVLWSTDVCLKSGDEAPSVGVVAWPSGDDAPPVGHDLPDFQGTTGLAAYGQSVAAFGTNASGDPLLAGKSSDEATFSSAEVGALAGVELYEHPVIVADKSGWLYTVARVPEAPEAPADRLTVLVKATTDESWSYAPGVALPTNADGVVPVDLTDEAFTGAKPGLDLAPAPPFHLHALLWRASLTGTDNPPMAFHYRLDLSAETVASPSDLSADSAEMESIPFFPDVPFSLLSDQVVGRIAVVAEPVPDGLTTWNPYVAHWIGNQEGGIHERLLVLRRAQAGEDVVWETLYTHTEDNASAQAAACSEAPKGPDDVCAYTLQSERLLDLAGGDRLRMLLATHTSSCEVTAMCDDAGLCTWAGLEFCNPGGYGYTVRYQNAIGQWASDATDDIADAPIEQGAILIGEQGTVHVVVSTLKGGVVKLRHDPMVFATP